MTLKRFSEGWRIIELAETHMYPNSSKAGSIHCTLKEDQFERAIKASFGHFERIAA